MKTDGRVVKYEHFRFYSSDLCHEFSLFFRTFYSNAFPYNGDDRSYITIDRDYVIHGELLVPSNRITHLSAFDIHLGRYMVRERQPDFTIHDKICTKYEHYEGLVENAFEHFV
jgi:hypothetical protein